jgi:hypothetical protein
MKKILLIIGSAEEAKEDITRFNTFGIKYDRMMIGIDAYGLKELSAKYFASYHPDDLVKLQVRPFIVISHRQFRDMVDIIKPIDLLKEKSGSSAMLGVLVGIDEGYDKIVLCGCPMIGKNKNDYSYSNFHKGWYQNYNHIKDKVRSMSGWTKELLGMPDMEWLNGK